VLQIALNDFNMNLPNELRFQTPTFRRYVPLNQGGCFALIHVSGGKDCRRLSPYG